MSQNFINLVNFMDEDFVNYKKCSMFLGFSKCSFKCCIEAGCNICQNSELANAPVMQVSISNLYERYKKNGLSEAIVCGGLEPFDTYTELLELVKYFRSHECNDEFVIYTGYNKDEIASYISELSKYPNIIIKFGRFIPDQIPRKDQILGVELASPNQYAEVIS